MCPLPLRRVKISMIKTVATTESIQWFKFLSAFNVFEMHSLYISHMIIITHSNQISKLFKENYFRKIIDVTMVRDRQHGPIIELNRVRTRYDMIIFEYR